MLQKMLRWLRTEDGLILQIREDIPKEGEGIKSVKWKHYTESILYKGESAVDFFSLHKETHIVINEIPKNATKPN